MADDLEQLQAYLNALPDAIRKELSDAVQAEAERLSEAQRAALKNLEQSPDETGNLEQSCTVTPGEHDLEFIVQAGGPLTTVEIREGSGVEYDYALAFEFGTSRQPARPFFYPTYNVLREDMESNIEKAIEKALK